MPIQTFIKESGKVEKQMVSELSSTPMALCTRVSGSMISSMAMAVRAGTIIKSNIRANSLMERNLEMAVLNSKVAITKEILSMDSFTATANIILLILVNYMKVNSKITTWTVRE